MKNEMDRREFTLMSALAILSGVVITITGCGSDSPTSSGTTSGGGQSDVNGVVSANHGHTARITAAQLTAGNDIRLDITGTANHPHSVELSAAELSQIRSGQRVSKASSTNDSHDHTVTFN